LRDAFGLGYKVLLPSAWLHAARCVIFGLVKKRAAKVDPISDYMRDVDRTLLRENLKLSFEQRAQKHFRALQMVEELRRAGKKLRQKRDGC